MGAVDFLFTPTVQRVLGALLLRPEQSFTLQELLRLGDAGRGSAQSQIDRLVEAGVLSEEPRRGRQRSIRANADYFLFGELRSIALKTFGVAEPIRDALRPHARRIQEAFLFGSVVKGLDSATSDIDLIVVGNVRQKDLFEIANQLQHRLGRRVQFSLYEPAEWRALVRDDPVVGQIVEGPRLRLIPDAETG